MNSILFLTVLSFANIANAANWEWITSNNKIGFFFDTQSFQKFSYSENYTVWIKQQYTEAYGEKTSKELGLKEAVSHTLSKQEFDFKNQKMRILALVFYGKSGAIITSSNTASQWNNIIPESIGEAIIIKTYTYYQKYYQ